CCISASESPPSRSCSRLGRWFAEAVKELVHAECMANFGGSPRGESRLCHSHGHSTPSSGVVAELAELVVPPAPNRAVGADTTGVPGASRDSLPVPDGHYLRWN